MPRKASRSPILLLVALLASLATLLDPPAASAHPLGQNSINLLPRLGGFEGIARRSEIRYEM